MIPEHDDPIPDLDPAACGTAVDASVEDMRSWLPLFDSVVALTANASVTMSETGAYARPTLAGEPWDASPHRIDLRIAPELLGPLVATTESAPTDPDCLQVVGSDDRLLHRGFVTSPGDRLALQSLAAHGHDGWAPRALPAERPVRQCLGSERAHLAAAGTIDHVDSALVDTSRRRGQALAGCGRDVTSAAHPAEVLHMLLHLGELGVPLTAAVPARGLMQLHTGRIDSLRHTRHGTSVGMDACSVVVDPDTLGHGWVTRPVEGPALIELHDLWGRCVLMLFSAAERGSASAIRWEHITAMLSIGGAGGA